MIVLKRGFTLIELLVVIGIIGLLSSVVLSSLNSARVKARNAQRLETMKQVELALDLYYDKYGRYPSPSSDASCGGWDTDGDGSFISALVTEGFIKQVSDSGFGNPPCGNYQYYRYGAGNAGCPAAQGSFYVLGVKTMEGSGAYATSPGFSCSGRNWQTEYQWVTGKFEN